MTRRRISRGAFAIVLAASAQAVVGQGPLTLESLKAPGMPAGTIIGAQVNEINRPKSLKALEAAILGNFLNEDRNSLVVPNAYALEVQPFMLGSLKKFNYNDYIADVRHVGDILWRNLALSVASTKEFRIRDSVATDALGTGLRLVFWQGKVSDDLKAAFTVASTANLNSITIKQGALQGMTGEPDDPPLASVGAMKDAALAAVRTILDADPALTAATKNNLVAQVEAVFNALPPGTTTANAADKFEDLFDEMFLDDALDDLKKVIDRVGTERYGWHVEFNGATSWHFPTNEVGYSFTGRYGGWITAAFRPKRVTNGATNATGSEFMLMIRGIGHHPDLYSRYQPLDSTFDRGSNLDIGLQYAYTRPRWSVELELIQRWNQVREVRIVEEVEYYRNINNASTKVMLGLNYAVAPNVNLSYNFGKDFDDVFNTGDLISLVNLNLAFGGVDASELLP